MRILINHVEPGSFILGLRRLAGYCDFFFFACQVVKISDKSAHPLTPIFKNGDTWPRAAFFSLLTPIALCNNALFN